jgi:DNA-binding CsgD family transcriptional regulator
MPLAELSKDDLVFLLEFVDTSLATKSHSELRRLLIRLSSEIPTNGVIAGLVPADINPQTVSEASFLNVSYPEEWLAEYQRRGYFFCDPVKRQRLGGTDFQVWSRTFARAEVDAEKHFVHHAREYGISEGITVGVNRPSESQVSFFSFMGTDLPEQPRHLTLLRFVAPYLHEAMRRGMRGEKASKEPDASLSGREKEVLSWAMAGKTNWEISMILKISERTVKFHVQNVMKKLDASTRTHAVAIALDRGMIQH